MGRLRQSPKVAALPDLTARVIYFPVRHHSPACAWHVAELIRQVRPSAVLIEGPRDATPLLPLLVSPDTVMPVAFYTTYVRRHKDQIPERHAAYYPLCDFSPELAAIRAGLEVGATVQFIDLTFPEKVETQASIRDEKAPPSQRRSQSLQDEGWISHSRLLKAACQTSGARDADDLWDHLFEDGYERLKTAEFMRDVLAYCSLARHDYSRDELRADGTLAREQAMAAAVAAQTQRTVVVTGGFHTVVLAESELETPKPLQLAPDDNQLVLMRYSFEQLDRLNGYASGMPSPAFYQFMWDGRDATSLLVEVARQCRRKNLGASTADAIAAVHHAQGLAELRGHRNVLHEDLLDAVRSLYIKGVDDAEGVAVLAIARKLLAGDRVGNVPAEAGQPPIVHDFRHNALQLRLKLDKLDGVELLLDLYRQAAHRRTSRLFHQLAFLEIPFATFVRGPDFVAGQNLERVQEVWNYHWSPQTESALIERSLYGSTVEEAACSVLLDRFQQAESQGQGRSAAVATQLVLQACRMGLLRQTPDLLRRVAQLLQEDGSFISLVTAMENLLALEVSREPLEAHHLTGLHELAATAYRRACFLIPALVATPSEEENLVLDGLNSLLYAVTVLAEQTELQELRREALETLAKTTGGSAAVRGGAVGLLYGDGQASAEEIVRHLRGHLLSSRDGGADGPNFLRGLLKTARDALWQVPECLASLNEVLEGWDESQFPAGQRSDRPFLDQIAERGQWRRG